MVNQSPMEKIIERILMILIQMAVHLLAIVVALAAVMVMSTIFTAAT